MARANKLERYMLSLINQDRREAGLDALRLDGSLNGSAERHSEWMLNRDVFSHNGAHGSTPESRMRDAGYALRGNWRTGENIALQSERGAAGLRDDVRDLHALLMQSPSHRANLMNPAFHEIGIGLERGMFRLNGSLLNALVVTEDFGRTSARHSAQSGAQSVARQAEADSADAGVRKAGPGDAGTLVAAHNAGGADSFVLRDRGARSDHDASAADIAAPAPDHLGGGGVVGQWTPSLLAAGEDAFDFGASGGWLLD